MLSESPAHKDHANKNLQKFAVMSHTSVFDDFNCSNKCTLDVKCFVTPFVILALQVLDLFWPSRLVFLCYANCGWRAVVCVGYATNNL